MDFEKFFKDQINYLHHEKRYRFFTELAYEQYQFPYAIHNSDEGSRKVTIWCSNDYLGMGKHPKVIENAQRTFEKCGIGAGGTRNIAGTNYYHVMLE
ncbi:5-aminolevulinate synthase, partial [Candidatus Liberibacter asiaticus]